MQLAESALTRRTLVPVTSRVSFRFKSRYALLTFDHKILDSQDIVNWANEEGFENTCTGIESHKDGTQHTHIVVSTHYETPYLFDVKPIMEKFGQYPNMKRITNQHEWIKAMAYVSKETTPTLWNDQGSTEYLKDKIMEVVWQYGRNAILRGPKFRLMQQYNRLKKAWYPLQTEGAEHDPVVTESPSEFFP